VQVVASQLFGGVTGAVLIQIHPRTGAAAPINLHLVDRGRPPPQAYDWQGATNRSGCRCLLPWYWYAVLWTLGLHFLFLSFPVLSLISTIIGFSNYFRSTKQSVPR
jgi:hypothetical protein